MIFIADENLSADSQQCVRYRAEREKLKLQRQDELRIRGTPHSNYVGRFESNSSDSVAFDSE